jgi:hypothetical protein
MPTDTDTPSPEGPPRAAQLRMMLLEKEMEKAKQAEKAREAEKKKLNDFSASFLGNHISEEELAMVRRLVLNAVNDGKFEALVYSFPSELCTDGGRAINNASPNWPSTLQGKAKELYERYEAVAKPAGYRLKAMIINFPGGVPGDAGFFMNWAPEQV